MTSKKVDSTDVTMSVYDTISEKRPKQEPYCVPLMLTALTTLAVVAITALLILYIEKGNEEPPTVCSTQNLSQSISSGLLDQNSTVQDLHVVQEQETDTDQVCRTRDCILTAGQFARNMDLNVDPCSNFAQFACGSFYKEAEIPRDSHQYHVFYQIWDSNRNVFRKITEAPILGEDPDYLVKIKQVYQACMDEETIEKYALDNFLNSTVGTKWPTLNPNWNDTNFDISDAIAEFAPLNAMPIFRVHVRPQLFNSSEILIHLSEPKLLMSVEFLKKGRNSTQVMALQNYYEQLAIYAGADPQTAHDDAVNVIDLLVEFGKYMAKSNEPVSWSWVSLSAWSDAYFRYMDYLRIVESFFSYAGINVTGGEEIVIVHWPFFRQMHRIIDRTDARTIQNVIAFHAAHRMLDELSVKIRKIYDEYYSELYGETEEVRSPWEVCQHYVVSSMWEGMTKEFVKETFSEQAKADTNHMIDLILEEYHDIINSSDWMANSTKAEARLKLDNLGRKIGYPDVNFSEADINQMYSNIEVLNDNYFQTRLNIRRFLLVRNLRTLLAPTDKNQWLVKATTTNAFYVPLANEIVFPVGVLQPPIYSEKYGFSIIFGAIGSVIGHEIMHAFDPNGSGYDWAGNLRNWWTDNDEEVYVNKSQCTVDRFFDFIHPLNNETVDGYLTLGENLADDYGVRASYRAYQELRRTATEEKPLPGLGLSLDQQFFLSFSRTYCELWREKLLTAIMQRDRHAPGRFRIIGVLQNNADFARAFNCSSQSYMNPSPKCELW